MDAMMIRSGEADSIWWRRTKDSKPLMDEEVDQVIDAFEEGKLTGYKGGFIDGVKQAREFEEKAAIRLFVENLNKAAKVASDASTLIEGLGVKIDALLLKVRNKASFDVAIIMPFEDYISEHRRKISQLTLDIEAEHCSDMFDIEFLMIPHKESLNWQLLTLDGYILEYAKYQRTQEA